MRPICPAGQTRWRRFENRNAGRAAAIVPSKLEGGSGVLKEWAWRLAELFEAEACGVVLGDERATCDLRNVGWDLWAVGLEPEAEVHVLRAKRKTATVVLLRRDPPFAPMDQRLLEVVVRRLPRLVIP